MRRLLLLAAAAVLTLVVVAVASADNVQHDVVDSSGLVTVAPGASASVSFRIHETGSDGCAPATGEPTVVTLAPSGPVGASQTSLTFTACDSGQGVTFTVAADAAPGDYSVAVSAADADDAIGGDAGVTIRVPAPPAPTDTTPPVVTSPGNQTLEATSPSGASQSFSGNAVDNVDGSLNAPCTPTSFPLGPSTATCSATDAAGNIGSATFQVTVQDTTAPSLSLPASITAGATSGAGAPVTYSASASDAVGVTSFSCTPASGSTFPIGTTPVSCSAADAAGNSTSGGFSVTVTDGGPSIVVSPTQVVEAASATGANVNFVPPPSASDIVDGALEPSCTPVSGSRFPLGTTTVGCTVTDSGGTVASASFDVVVRDTTPPVVTPPASVVVVAEGPVSKDDPRVVRFLTGASAADLVGVASFSSNAPGFFPIGSSAVTFTAVDAAGNVGVSSAVLEVRLPSAGPPPPPAAQNPPARVPPANVGNLRVRTLDRAVHLEWRAVVNATRYVVTRTDRAGAAVSVYDGRATSFVDRGLVNGQEYRYVVVSHDANGLRSVGVAVVAVPALPFVLLPRHDAVVRRPPALTWRRVTKASYYNVQLFRISASGARTKVLSTWPVRPRLQLRASWRYERRAQRLSPGTYEWFLWAGFGPRASQIYGPLLGWSRFSVRRPG